MISFRLKDCFEAPLPGGGQKQCDCWVPACIAQSLPTTGRHFSEPASLADAAGEMIVNSELAYDKEEFELRSNGSRRTI